jgi:hypothetical protein
VTDEYELERLKKRLIESLHHGDIDTNEFTENEVLILTNMIQSYNRETTNYLLHYDELPEEMK